MTMTRLTEARTAALSYWAEFGWPALVSPHGVWLVVQHQEFAMSVPVEIGSQLVLALDGEQGTVLQIPLGNDCRWMFLVSGDAEFPPVGHLPGVKVTVPGVTIPLPPSELKDGPVRWIRRPAAGGDGRYQLSSVEHALSGLDSPLHVEHGT